jgi:ribonuclease D
MRPHEQAIARALAGWREERAIAADRPRGWILADEVLYALATRAPVTPDELSRIPALPPAVMRKRGDELLAVIAAAKGSAVAEDMQSPPQRPTPEQTHRIGELQQLVRDVADAHGLSPEVLATRRDVEALVLSPGSSPSALSGWRRTVIGERLLARLAD